LIVVVMATSLREASAIFSPALSSVGLICSPACLISSPAFSSVGLIFSPARARSSFERSTAWSSFWPAVRCESRSHAASATAEIASARVMQAACRCS
jgi:hypothetical protein